MWCLVILSFVLVNIPPLPKTKDHLKEKNRKLRKELDTLRRQYRDNVYSVIERLKGEYDETKHDLTPSYEKLKHLIKEATSEEVLEGCRVPEHKHSVQNKGIDHCEYNHWLIDCLGFYAISAILQPCNGGYNHWYIVDIGGTFISGDTCILRFYLINIIMRCTTQKEKFTQSVIRKWI